MSANWEQRVAIHRELWLQRFVKALEKERSEQTTQTSLANKDKPIQEGVLGNSFTLPLSPQSPLFVGTDTPINGTSQPTPSTTQSPKEQDLAISGASSYRDNLAAGSDENGSRGDAQHQGVTRKRFRAENPQRSTAASPRSVSSTELPISAASLAGIQNQKKPRLSANALPNAPSSKDATLPPSAGTPQSPPEWYTSINLDRAKPKRGDRETVARLRNIGLLVDQAKAEAITKARIRPGLFDKIRNELHCLEFIDVTEYSVRKAQLLDNDKGLPQFFDTTYSSGVKYPWDIRADAQEVYNKFYQKMFTTDLLRGIKAHPKGRFVKDPGWSIVCDKITWKYHGNGFLVNGQWWPRQICAVRDGAHGCPVGGIAGIKGEGAVSVVMSGDEYHDEDRDDGEEVLYCGTKAKEGSSEPTEMTTHLLDSVKSGKPVRLMRSSNLYGSKFKPSEGFRYDGLYDVVDKELLDPETHHYRFHLLRRKGQTPIRYQGLGARPTAEERKAWGKVQIQLGMKGCGN